MADDEVERVRDQVFADRLSELREDRAEVLAELESARGDGVALWVTQLEGVDREIAAIAEQRAQSMRNRKKNQATPPGPPEQGRLL